MTISNHRTNHMFDSAPNHNYMRPIIVSDDTPALGYVFVGFIGGLWVGYLVFCAAVGLGWLK